MEIRDFLHAAKHRLWIIVLIPLVAAGVSFGLAQRTPQQFRAKALVEVPNLADRTTSAGSVSQFVANFKAVLDSDALAEEVATKSGTSAKAVHSGIDASQQASSNLIEVTYESSDAAQTGAVVQAATTGAIKRLSEPVLQQAQRTADAAHAKQDSARKEVEALSLTSGAVLPDAQYRTISDAISQLQIALLQAQAAGNDALAARLSDQIQSKQADLESLAGTVLELQRLEDAAAQANNAVINAETTLQQAIAQVEATTAGVTVGDPIRLSHSAFVEKVVAIATTLAALFALGLVLLLEALRPRNTPAEEASPATPLFVADIPPTPPTPLATPPRRRVLRAAAREHASRS